MPARVEVGPSHFQLVHVPTQPLEQLAARGDALLFPELRNCHACGPGKSNDCQGPSEVRLPVGGQGEPQERDEHVRPGVARGDPPSPQGAELVAQL
eukprot:9860181-Alexandrium_andersonii.AAC.1